MNQTTSSLLTAVIPITSLRDDSKRIERWINSNDLKSIRLIFVYDSRFPPKNLESLIHLSKADETLVEFGDFQGPGPSRNLGLKMVKTEWICFWDSDDLPILRNVQRLLGELEASTCDVAIGEFETATSEIIGEDKNVKSHSHNSYDLLSLMRNPGIWRFVFKTNLLQGLSFPKSLMGEDQVFLSRFFEKAREITWLDYPIYRYIQHNELQLTKDKTSVDSLLDSTNLIYKRIHKMDPSTKKFGVALVLKQTLTVIKKSNVSLKFESLGIAIKILIRYPVETYSALFHLLFLKRIKNSGSIHVALNGGLGNQLFELAAGLHYSEGRQIFLESAVGYPRQIASNKAALEGFTFPTQINFVDRRRWRFYSKYTNLQLSMGLDEQAGKKNRLITFVGRILAFAYFKKNINVNVNTGVGWTNKFKLSKRNELIIGYFQSFKTQDDGVLSLLRNSLSSLENESLRDYLVLSDLENPLVVHVRMGDYKYEPNFGIPGNDYYFEAIRKLFKPGVHSKIWLFSDEAELALNRIPEELVELTRVIKNVGGSDLATLVAMMQGRDYVIANSTYSWWAARLSINQNAQVAYPHPWFKNLPVPNQLIPPHWTAFSSNFEKS
jgi:hypothetical protein